jgi:hypothetical protein
MLLYGSTLFLSAFLLFLVQPLLGKYILPWFGGTPAVWTTCMLFFQVMLLAGYGYAHLLAVRLPIRRQALVHCCLVLITILTLPVIPSSFWKPQPGRFPVWSIMGLLAASVGPTYLLLSATGPLLQSWLPRKNPGMSPYPLYALSNLGSLLALPAFPFLIEPALTVSRQSHLWSWWYVVFAALTVLCTLGILRLAPGHEQNCPVPEGPKAKPSKRRKLLWMALAACGSVNLLATTNQICQDVAVVPLLWILPLGLYLVTFILCFQRRPWYSRAVFTVVLAGALAQACIVLFKGVFLDVRLQIVSYAFTLFACCMVCHGELVRLKPAVAHLTSFYLIIASGGAVGGALVTLLAPHLFVGFWEYHLVLLVTPILLLSVIFRDPGSRLAGGRPIWLWAACYVGLVVLAASLAVHISRGLEGTLEVTRNFFGVLRVLEQDKDVPEGHRYVLMHGRIEHGFQYRSSEKRYWPTSYFGPASGAGLAIQYHPKRIEGKEGLRVGIVGLGTGTLASYGQQGDYFRFYEINPEVVRLADRYFTYRKDSDAAIDVVLGDARISMEREKDRGERQHFDILAVDAFASDAIPVHLLTRECYQIYRYHMQEDGILAMHISSRYFDLGPVVRSLPSSSRGNTPQVVWVPAEGNPRQGTDSTDWVLITSNARFLSTPDVQTAIASWPAGQTPMLWTDDYTNILSLLRTKTARPAYTEIP